MAINEVMGLTLDLSANTDKFVKDLQNAAKDTDLELGFNTGALVKRFGDAQKDLKGVFAKTVAEAASIGLSKTSIEGFVKKLSPLTDQIESSMKKVFDLKVAAHRKGLDDNTKKEKLSILANEQQKLRSLQLRHDWEKKATDRLLDRRKKAIQDAEQLAARTRSEAAEEFGKGIADAFSSLKSGDFASVLKKAGKGVQARGVGLEMKGAAMGGPMGKIAGSIGTLMAALGPVIMAVGALTAGIAAIVGIAVAADGAMKQLNRTMFDSGMAIGELDTSYSTAGDTVNRVRKTFTKSMDFNMIWGTTAKDHLEILGAYAKAGLTFRELTAGVANAADEMERLKAATEASLTYSKLLGTSSSEMAEAFATRMEELSTDIDGVREAFSSVHMAARESGFGVKRFFNMVLQATSGMSMYNVRMEEAAGLLMRLGGILGSKMGGDFLANLTKGFGDESTQDKYKRVMTTGEGRTKATFGRSAKATSERFVKNLEKKDLSDAFAAAAKRAKLTVDFKDSKQLVKDLGGLSAKDQTRLLAEARQSGDEDMVRALTNLTMVAQGAKGGTGNMAMNLGGLDMGGKLMMSLQQGMAVLKKPLHLIKDPEQMMAFESITGVSGEQLEQLKRVSQAMSGNRDSLEALRSDEARYAGMTTMERKAAQIAQVKAYGAYVTEGGKVFAAKMKEGGTEIDPDSATLIADKQALVLGDYVQTQGDAFAKAAKEALGMDLQLAQEQVARTTEMTKILEQGVEFWLESIYGVTEGILNWLSGGSEKKERQKELDRLAKEMSGNREKIREKEKEIADKSAAMMTAETPADKDKLAIEIKAAREDIAARQVGLKQVQEDRERVLRSGAKWMGVRRAGQFGSQGKGAEVEEPLADKVREEGAKRAREKWLMHKFGTTDKEEYLAQRKSSTFGKTLPPSLIKHQVEQSWAAAEHFAGKYGGNAAVAEAGGRDYQVPLEMTSQKEYPWHNIRSRWNDLMDSVNSDWGWETESGSHGKGRSGEQFEGGHGFAAGSQDFADFKAIIEDTDYSDVVNSQRAQRIAASADAERLFAKTGAGAKGIAGAIDIDGAFDRNRREQMQTDLGNILDQAKLEADPRAIVRMVEKMGKGEMPEFLQKNLNEVVKEGDEKRGIAPVTVQDLLREKGMRAHDWVGGSSNGKIWGSIIDTADDVVATASKGGGPVAHAGRGGSSVVINSFGNAAEVIRGIQAAVAAGVV